MKNTIWFMSGLNSQRDIIAGAKQAGERHNHPFRVLASHHQHRHEILEQADAAFIEPAEYHDKLAFITAVVDQYRVDAIHVGRDCRWFEQQRAAIEATGVALTTGARSLETFEYADDKVAFAALMAQSGLAVVPSLRVDSHQALRSALAAAPFDGEPVCIKPMRGIYGQGFWKLDASASPTACFDNVDRRCVHPGLFLTALERAETMQPMVLMPYLPGPEHSVDMLVENGTILAAVGRRKEGALQYLIQSGAAFELAKACAQILRADGLVNVQTRADRHGDSLLLEINLRPSGGIGYTRHCGVNLPGLFASRQLARRDADETRRLGVAEFRPVTVRSVSDAQPYPAVLRNLINLN